VHVVCLVEIFQEGHGHKETHVAIFKRIFRYLNDTLDYGLFYPRDTNFTLSAYIDAYWARCVDERMIRSGGAFFLGCSLVSWLNKKKDSFFLSIDKDEYIDVASYSTQVLWMKHTLKYITMMFDNPICLLCDNTSAIKISKNLVMHSIKKHITIIYHFLREKVMEDEVKLEYVLKKY
jgi:hypothetical protein